MAIVKMTLTEALAKRSTLLKRLENWSLSDESNYVNSANKQMIFIKKASDPKVGTLTIDECKKQAQSVFDKMCADLNNYVALTMAINDANVTHTVTIAGKEMTIAAAIAYKSAAVVKSKNAHLNIIERQIRNITKSAEDYKRRIEASDALNSYLTVALGPEENRKPADVEEQIKLYNKTNGIEIIDPLNLREKIDDMKKDHNEFMDQVDTALSIANAKIEIEVEFVD